MEFGKRFALVVCVVSYLGLAGAQTPDVEVCQDPLSLILGHDISGIRITCQSLESPQTSTAHGAWLEEIADVTEDIEVGDVQLYVNIEGNLRLARCRLRALLRGSVNQFLHFVVSCFNSHCR